MTKVYEFNEKLAEGMIGESRLDKLWDEQRWKVVPASRHDQRCGIDRWLVARVGGRRVSLEYKTDAVAGKTGNAFVETISVSSCNKPGWAFSSKATWLVYQVVEPETIYIIRMASLRARLTQWQSRYPSRDVPNRGYKTTGILVPLDEFERIADKVF